MVGLAQPYHNPHLADVVAEAARVGGLSLRLLVFSPAPSFRKDNAWESASNHLVPAAGLARWLACIRWITSCDRFLFLGLGDPFPTQSLLVILACLTGRPLFLASEGLKNPTPSSGLRFLCWFLSLFDNGQLLAIGNTAAQDFARAGLSWPARQFGFAEAPPGESAYQGGHPHPPPIKLLVVGQLITRKRVDWLMRELARHPFCTLIELMVCGTGPEREKLESLAAKLGLNVRFLGFRRGTDLAAAFQDADIFVHPASYEGWGVVLNHALHFGLPILAAEQVHSARGLLVQEGLNGFVFTNEEEFASQLGKLTADASLRRRFSLHSRQLGERWSVSNMGRCLALVLADAEISFPSGQPLSPLSIS